MALPALSKPPAVKKKNKEEEALAALLSEGLGKAKKK
jgi:hypothetical protein